MPGRSCGCVTRPSEQHSDFIHGLRGECRSLLKRNLGNWWYDLLKPTRNELVVWRSAEEHQGRGTRMTRSMHASWPTGVHEQAQLESITAEQASHR